MEKVEVAWFDDLREAVPKPVKAAGREIVLVRWRGKVYAVRNICPHQSASFETGRVHPQLTCTFGEPVEPTPGRSGGGTPSMRGAWDFSVDDAVPLMQCPWHKWEFRLTDGRCATDQRFRVRAYVTHIEHGRVFVETV